MSSFKAGPNMLKPRLDPEKERATHQFEDVGRRRVDATAYVITLASSLEAFQHHCMSTFPSFHLHNSRDVHAVNPADRHADLLIYHNKLSRCATVVAWLLEDYEDYEDLDRLYCKCLYCTDLLGTSIRAATNGQTTMGLHLMIVRRLAGMTRGVFDPTKA